MNFKSFIWPILVVAGIVWLTTVASQTSAISTNLPAINPLTEKSNGHDSLGSLQEAVQEVNHELARLRAEANLTLAEPADDLTVWRRLSLALHGTIPSLEEIRLFETDQEPKKLSRWLQKMLLDDRFSDYFAERLARSYVGVENGQFLIFRRDRFLSWLSQQLKAERPYDEIVRQMISGKGVWTGSGQVNFITSGYADGDFDPNKLTARSTRAFLGQRMDCVQCHDSKVERDESRFQVWKQTDFHGISAHFGQVDLSLSGVYDNKENEHTFEDGDTFEETEIAPNVPFHPEWMGTTGSRRERLARWMTHPENQRFERATANRIWGLLFGTPFVVNQPVDDLPDPGTDPNTEMLDILGADFREHNYDLRRMITVICASDAFRMSSISAEITAATDQADLQEYAVGQADQPTEVAQLAKEHWAVFPLVRLRPEQVIGSMLQANNIRTIDQNSHLFIRALRFFRENGFVDEFGDPGVNELQEWSGTIPQALLRMNGELSRELTQLNPFFAPGRIAATASTPEKIIETSFLTCLTRYPTDTEKEYFLDQFEKHELDQSVEDLYWILFNSPEFSWNH